MRLAFLLIAVGLAVWAVARDRAAVVDALGRLTWWTVLLAAIGSVGNVVLAAMSWRVVLADLGSRLPLRVAARVYLVGQLGKYVPGSVWQVLTQAELGRDHGVPRRRTASALVISLLLSVTSALVLVLVTVPFAPGVLPARFRWAVLLVPVLLAVLHPRILGPLLDGALRLARRDPLEHRPSTRGMAEASGWALLSWVSVGLQVWLLARGLGASSGARLLLLCLGGYALAWAVGFVVLVAPAGAGAREAALAAVLGGVLGTGGVLVVVLVSRLLLTATDLGLAALAGGSLRRPPGQRPH